MSPERVVMTVVGVVLGYVISASSLVDLWRFISRGLVTGNIYWGVLPRAAALFLSGMAFAVISSLLFR